jgi:hypothetical protein
VATPVKDLASYHVTEKFFKYTMFGQFFNQFKIEFRTLALKREGKSVKLVFFAKESVKIRATKKVETNV